MAEAKQQNRPNATTKASNPVSQASQIDQKLEEVSRAMTVVVAELPPEGALRPSVDQRPSTGGVFHVPRDDGSVGQYIISNNHSVGGETNGQPDKLSGMVVNGEVYHFFYDQKGNPGLARLASHASEVGGKHIDQSVLEVLDPVRDQKEIRAVLQAFKPDDAARFDKGELVLPARPHSLPLDQIDDISTQVGRQAHSYQVSGYPIGAMSDAARIREGKVNANDKPKFETMVGKYVHLEGDMKGLTLVPTGGGNGRPGYSGSIVFNTETGKPVGILYGEDEGRTVEGNDGVVRELGTASPLIHAANEIRRIEQVRTSGGYVSVSPNSRTTEPGFHSVTHQGVQQPNVAQSMPSPNDGPAVPSAPECTDSFVPTPGLPRNGACAGRGGGKGI